MPDRILFEGQEYDSIEAMPPATRAAYQDAISKLRQSSADAAGVLQDIGEKSPALFSRTHSEHYLRAHHGAKQTAAKVLPILLGLVAAGMMTVAAWTVWRLNASVRAQAGDFSIGPGFLVLVVVTAIAGIALAIWMTMRKPEPAGVLRVLDGIEQVGARILQILLAVAAGGVVAGGYWMISHMDASSRSQGGNIFVGLGVVVALACLAGMYVSIEMRLKK
jgi:hypothetical protein